MQRVQNLKSRIRRSFVLAMLALLLLTGCWPLPPDSAATPRTPVATISPLSGLPSAGEGGVSISLASADPPTLDPALATDPYSLSIIRQLFSNLVTLDGDLRVVPDIASALPQVSADGKTYTFPLRKGVRFTNGQEVTSADFKYSIERASDPRLAGPNPPSTLPAAIYLGDIVGVKERLAGKAKDVSGVVAPDPYTLVLTIDVPRSYFLAKLAAGPGFVVQRSNVEGSELWTEQPLGTGPFKLQKWERNRYITLARNSDYFGGAPEVPIVNIEMGRDPSGDIERYVNGSGSGSGSGSGLDAVTVPLDNIEAVLDRNNPLSRELISTPDPSVTYLGFNIRQKPFEDPKIREAFARSLDRQKLARTLFRARVQATDGLALPGVGGYKPLSRGELYNVTRARQLLAESTYKDPKNLPGLNLFTSGDIAGPLISQELSRTLGLDVGVNQVEWSDYVSGLSRGDYPIFLAQTSAAYPDPSATLGFLLDSTSADNLTGYLNADVDTLLSAAASEGDEGKRLADYTQVEGQALSEYVVVPLYRAVRYTLVKPYLRGLTLTPFGLLSLRGLRVVGR